MAKFKVGDRVRFKKSYPTSVAGCEAVVVAITNWGIQVDTPSYGRSTESPDSLEPALTIEVGKFYRTRNGSKAGPIGWNDTYLKELFPFVDTTDISDCWSSGGKFLYPGHHDSDKDLIAEWIDEPASNDNAPLSKPAIVALIEDGQAKPSEQPKVHKSEESATDEAERLAVKYPGQKFGVFVLADSRIADVVIRRAA
nr:hypothetical protein [Brucella anthropi]